MLAKIWKKVLLAVCIVACIFNIMTKLINRSSLENNLKNVEGESIFSILKQEEQKQESGVIDGDVNEVPANAQTNETTEEAGTSSNEENTNEIIKNTTSDYVVLN